MKTKSIHIILFLFLCLQTWTQIPVEMNQYSLKQIKKFAKNSERIGDVYSAIDFYQYYSDKKEKDLEVLSKLAELYKKARDYQNAAQCYEFLYESDPSANKLALYYGALMFMQLGKYNEAAEMFNEFKDTYKTGDNSRLLRKLAANYALACIKSDSLKAIKNDVLLSHLNSSINKPYVELSPYPINDTLMLYSSLRLDSMQYYSKNDSNLNLPLRQFYYAKRKFGKWEFNGKVEKNFNLENYNVGNGIYSQDGKRFYFTRCDNNWQNKLICSIFMTRLVDNNWTEPKMLPYPINNTNYTTTQPTVSLNIKKNTEVIYYSTDREDGRGGMDLWFTEYDYEKDIFKEPRNCGGKINTPMNEITPFYDMSTASLYFSSDGYIGLGGYDIYKSTGEMKNWLSIDHTGIPFNSSADDIYFSIAKNSHEGFFVSNRTGGTALKSPTCCDDIYYYKWNKFLNVTITGQIFNVPDNDIIELLVRKFKMNKNEFKKSKPAKDITVELYLFDESTNQSVFLRSDTTDGKGIYIFDKLERNKSYFILMKNYGYFDKRLSVSTKNLRGSDVIKLQDVGVNFIPDKPMLIDLYYESNQSELTLGSKTILDTTVFEIMKSLSTIIIEVSSHTDNVGDEDYNMLLSQQRAQTVVNYLISKGIEKERLVAHGYGETLPIAANENPNGTDNPQGRELNRRTEMRIIGSIKEFYDQQKEEKDNVKYINVDDQSKKQEDQQKKQNDSDQNKKEDSEFEIKFDDKK